MSIYNFGKKYSKIISIVLIIILLAWGGYTQLSHADDIIKIKLNSYVPVKEAGLWIKANSNTKEVVVTQSQPQTTYYSERQIKAISNFENASSFEEYIKEENPRYLEISVFEYHPQWVYTWPNENNSRPVQAYFGDAEKKQPVLIVYELVFDSRVNKTFS